MLYLERKIFTTPVTVSVAYQWPSILPMAGTLVHMLSAIKKSMKWLVYFLTVIFIIYSMQCAVISVGKHFFYS